MNKPRYIVGIDYSINSPGICIFDTQTQQMNLHFLTSRKKLLTLANNNPVVKAHPYPTYFNEIDRYAKLADWVKSILPSTDVHVFLEGYSYNSISASALQIAENTACLKLMLHKNNIRVSLVTPMQVKALASSGCAMKQDVYKAFVLDTKIDLKALFQSKAKVLSPPMGDLSDAYWIMKWGLQSYSS